MTTPVLILDDKPTFESGRRVALLAVKGFEKYGVPVTYWAELKNEPNASPAGYGPVLAAKCLAKEAAMVAPGLVAAGLKKRQDRLNSLPAVPAEGEDQNADERATLTQEVAELTALQVIVNADAVPRIDAFYDGLLALIGPNDSRVEQYTEEWNSTKAPFLPSPELPTEL